MFGVSVLAISLFVGWMVVRWHLREIDPMDELVIKPGHKNSVKKF